MWRQLEFAVELVGFALRIVALDRLILWVEEALSSEILNVHILENELRFARMHWTERRGMVYHILKGGMLVLHALQCMWYLNTGVALNIGTSDAVMTSAALDISMLLRDDLVCAPKVGRNATVAAVLTNSNLWFGVCASLLLTRIPAARTLMELYMVSTMFSASLYLNAGVCGLLPRPHSKEAFADRLRQVRYVWGCCEAGWRLGWVLQALRYALMIWRRQAGWGDCICLVALPALLQWDMVEWSRVRKYSLFLLN
jgi:hypothetical protein